jgi:hypothetical protein
MASAEMTQSSYEHRLTVQRSIEAVELEDFDRCNRTWPINPAKLATRHGDH